MSGKVGEAESARGGSGRHYDLERSEFVDFQMIQTVSQNFVD